MSYSKIKVIEHEDYGTYRIKRFSARQVEAMGIMQKDADSAGFKTVYWIIANALCDEDGHRIYSDEAAESLADEDLVYLNWLQDEILAHNKMKVGEAIKNSVASQSESLPTD